MTETEAMATRTVVKEREKGSASNDNEIRCYNDIKNNGGNNNLNTRSIRIFPDLVAFVAGFTFSLSLSFFRCALFFAHEHHLPSTLQLPTDADVDVDDGNERLALATADVQHMYYSLHA